MSTPHPQRVWLVALACALGLLDVSLTLLNQSTLYWSGDFSQVRELNPLGRFLLEWHPAAFGLLGLSLACSFAYMLWIIPWRWAYGLGMLLVLGHTIGVAGWLATNGPPGIALGCAAVVLIRVLWKSCELRVAGD